MNNNELYDELCEMYVVPGCSYFTQYDPHLGRWGVYKVEGKQTTQILTYPDMFTAYSVVCALDAHCVPNSLQVDY